MYNNRYISQGLGNHIPGYVNKLIMVKRRTESGYKNTRTKPLTEQEGGVTTKIFWTFPNKYVCHHNLPSYLSVSVDWASRNLHKKVNGNFLQRFSQNLWKLGHIQDFRRECSTKFQPTWHRSQTQELGWLIPGDINRWTMVKGRTENTYKHIRTKDLTYLIKMGGSEQASFEPFQISMELSATIICQVIWV